MEAQWVAQKTLLICTVGGTPQPVVKAIEKIRPGRVIFVCSKDTAPELSGPKPRLNLSEYIISKSGLSSTFSE